MLSMAIKQVQIKLELDDANIIEYKRQSLSRKSAINQVQQIFLMLERKWRQKTKSGIFLI